MAELDSAEFRLARFNRGIVAGAVTMVGLGLAGLGVDWLTPNDSPRMFLELVLMLAVGPMGLILLWYSLLRNPRPRLVPTHVRVADGVLSIEGLGRGLAVQRLREGHAVRQRDGSVLVRLERPWARPVELVAGDPAAAEALLAALRLDVASNRARFSLAALPGSGPLLIVALVVLFFGLVALGGSDPLFGVAMLAASIAIVVLVRWPARVDVGSDGLTIRRVSGRRFIAHDQIEFVYTFGRPEDQRQGVELLLRGGSKLRLPVKPGFTSEITADRTARLFHRVVDARSRRRGAIGQLNALLDAANQDPRAWIRALRDAAQGGHPHRSMHVDLGELWAILEDPSLSPAARSGAAIALGARIDTSGRERIRIVAKATAAEELRSALELAAEAEAEDDAALAAALTPLLRADSLTRSS